MSKPVINVAASVRQRLLNLARERKEDFGLLLTKYALERLLFRISQSEHRAAFILKGALLFELWTEETHRPTRDADFLSIGSSDPRRLEAIFKEICVLPVADDGLIFDPSSVTGRQANTLPCGEALIGLAAPFRGLTHFSRHNKLMNVQHKKLISVHG